MPKQRTVADSFVKMPSSSSSRSDEIPKTPLERTLSQASTAADDMAMHAKALVSELQGLNSLLHSQGAVKPAQASSVLLPARSAWPGSRQQTGPFPEAALWGNHGAGPPASPDATRSLVAGLPSITPARPQAAWQSGLVATAPGQMVLGVLLSDSPTGRRSARFQQPQLSESRAPEILQHVATEHESQKSSLGSIPLSSSTPQEPGTWQQQGALKRDDLDDALRLVRLEGSAPNATGDDARQKPSWTGTLGSDTDWESTADEWFPRFTKMVSSIYGDHAWIVFALFAACLSWILICIFWCCCSPSNTARQLEHETVTTKQKLKAEAAKLDGPPAVSKPTRRRACCFC